MLHFIWISLAWAGAGLTGNLLVVLAILEMTQEDRNGPSGGRRRRPPSRQLALAAAD